MLPLNHLLQLVPLRVDSAIRRLQGRIWTHVDGREVVVEESSGAVFADQNMDPAGENEHEGQAD